jgi:hypothetical protein
VTTKEKTLSLTQLREKMNHCGGCRDNFYNHPSWAKPGEGTSPCGHCWSLPKAKLVYRWSINMQTPMDHKSRFQKVRKYSCWHGDGPYRDILIKRLPAHLGGEWADKKEQKEEEGKA